MAFTEGQVCHEHWAGPHSWDRPLLWILARKQQNDVFGPWWEKHPLECEFERAMWDRHEGLPFLSKKATPPEAVGRSEVRCAQCPLSTAHKTPKLMLQLYPKTPQGSGGNNWQHNQLHNSAKTQNGCVFVTVTGKVLDNAQVLHNHLNWNCDTSADE